MYILLNKFYSYYYLHFLNLFNSCDFFFYNIFEFHNFKNNVFTLKYIFLTILYMRG